MPFLIDLGFDNAGGLRGPFKSCIGSLGSNRIVRNAIMNFECSIFAGL